MLKHAELGYFKTPMVSPGQFDFSGHGQNELTSYMDLEINGNIVIGTYVSAVSETGGRSHKGYLRVFVSKRFRLTC